MLKIPLIAFYSGQGATGSSGYKLEEIQSRWSDEKLESVHNYIQWLFPLNEGSAFNWEAPLLDEQQIEIFKTHQELQMNLIKSFKRMLAFYGFQCDDEQEIIKISPSPNYTERIKNWVTHPSNHNYLRITRILKSLRLLGLDNYAEAFFAQLTQLYAEEKDKISQLTYNYWKRAIGRR